MALTIAVIVSLVAVANAGFVWVDDDKEAWNPFQAIKMPQFPHPPMLPRLPVPPRLPGVPHLSGFPFSRGAFNVPYITLPNIPTPEQIANIKPGPNQIYNGVAVRSSSGIKKDKDGNIVKTGGTTILVNNNGEVEETKSGANPPDLKDPIIFPSMRT